MRYFTLEIDRYIKIIVKVSNNPFPPFQNYGFNSACWHNHDHSNKKYMIFIIIVLLTIPANNITIAIIVIYFCKHFIFIYVLGFTFNQLLYLWMLL